MIKDVILAETFGNLPKLPNALHLGLVQNVEKRVKAFRNAANDGTSALPKRVDDQLSLFITAVMGEDEAFVISQKSEYTKRIADADTKCDRLYEAVKTQVDTYTRFTFDAEKQEKAVKLQDCVKKYRVDVRENYEAENLKLQQLTQELTRNYQLELAAKAIGVYELIQQLKTAVEDMRSLLNLRNDERTYQTAAAMKQARVDVDEQYRLLILALNSAAVMDDDERRFEDLIKQLNEDLRYLRDVVLARKKSGGSDDDAPENSGDNDGGDKPSGGGSDDDGLSD